MSNHSVKAILLRSLTDNDFLNAILEDPQAVLDGYDLTAEERAAFAAHSPQLLSLARSGGEIAHDWPIIFLINFAFMTTDPRARARLETLLTEQLVDIQDKLGELNAPLVALRSMTADQREQYVSELLQRLEQ